MDTETRSQRVTREDLLMFVNACFACTGQKEFYSDGHGQSVSIGFLHSYIRVNYRRLYARMLACGVNHFNQAAIVENLLASGKDTAAVVRTEENALVTRALRALPTHRAMHLLEALATRGVNNRRTRAITQQFLSTPEVRDFRAVKYRRSFTRAAVHTHMRFAGELEGFLVKGWRERRFVTPLFESFRRAHYAAEAIYDLPYTIAEGLAQKHGVKRELFLERIESRLTTNERLRLQDASRGALGAAYDVEWHKLPLTRLASYALSFSTHERAERAAELEQGLARAATRATIRAGVRLGRVACVLDKSYSSAGSRDKRSRPLAVALGVSAYLRAAAADYRAFWTHPFDVAEPEVMVTPRGSTDLATPILAALAWQPDVLVIVSDGFDNDPPHLAGQILEQGMRLAPACFMLHVNPVYDTESFTPRALSPRVATMGIRDAEDIPTLLAFARFARGAGSVTELEAHLATRVDAFLEVAS